MSFYFNDLKYQVDGYLERDHFHRILRKVETLTGIPHLYLMIGLSAFAAIQFAAGQGREITVSVIALLYPAYHSIRAWRDGHLRDIKKWLSYWIVFAVLALTDTILKPFTFWIPYLWFFKCLILMWCYPSTFNGALHICTIISNSLNAYFVEQKRTAETDAASSDDECEAPGLNKGFNFVISKGDECNKLSIPETNPVENFTQTESHYFVDVLQEGAKEGYRTKTESDISILSVEGIATEDSEEKIQDSFAETMEENAKEDCTAESDSDIIVLSIEGTPSGDHLEEFCPVCTDFFTNSTTKIAEELASNNVQLDLFDKIPNRRPSKCYDHCLDHSTKSESDISILWEEGIATEDSEEKIQDSFAETMEENAKEDCTAESDSDIIVLSIEGTPSGDHLEEFCPVCTDFFTNSTTKIAEELASNNIQLDLFDKIPNRRPSKCYAHSTKSESDISILWEEGIATEDSEEKIQVSFAETMEENAKEDCTAESDSDIIVLSIEGTPSGDHLEEFCPVCTDFFTNSTTKIAEELASNNIQLDLFDKIPNRRPSKCYAHSTKSESDISILWEEGIATEDSEEKIQDSFAETMEEHAKEDCTAESDSDIIVLSIEGTPSGDHLEEFCPVCTDFFTSSTTKIAEELASNNIQLDLFDKIPNRRPSKCYDHCLDHSTKSESDISILWEEGIATEDSEEKIQDSFAETMEENAKEDCTAESDSDIIVLSIEGTPSGDHLEEFCPVCTDFFTNFITKIAEELASNNIQLDLFDKIPNSRPSKCYDHCLDHSTKSESDISILWEEGIATEDSEEKIQDSFAETMEEHAKEDCTAESDSDIIVHSIEGTPSGDHLEEFCPVCTDFFTSSTTKIAEELASNNIQLDLFDKIPNRRPSKCYDHCLDHSTKSESDISILWEEGIATEDSEEKIQDSFAETMEENAKEDCTAESDSDIIVLFIEGTPSGDHLEEFCPVCTDFFTNSTTKIAEELASNNIQLDLFDKIPNRRRSKCYDHCLDHSAKSESDISILWEEGIATEDSEEKIQVSFAETMEENAKEDGTAESSSSKVQLTT